MSVSVIETLVLPSAFSALAMPGASILNEYDARRKELVDKDVSLRQDRAKYASMSDIERAAEEIVRRIRKEEALRVWSHEQDLFPGMAFLTGERYASLVNIKLNPQRGSEGDDRIHSNFQDA